MDTILAHWPADLPVPLLHPPPADLTDLHARLRHNNVAWCWVYAPELLQAHLGPATAPKEARP